jgi:hypothetical protein
MAFHVEISQSFRRARAFNLSEDELRRTVLGPWRAGRPVALGDREWQPVKSELRVLEGPALSVADLGLGQGWHNAERTAVDVSQQLAGAQAARVVAIHADDPVARQALEAALEPLGCEPAAWAAAGDGSAAFAVCVLAGDADPVAAFMLGAAAGALGSRRVLAIPAAAVTGEHAAGALADHLAALLGLAD